MSDTLERIRWGPKEMSLLAQLVWAINHKYTNADDFQVPENGRVL
jgi:hypothetical protein